MPAVTKKDLYRLVDQLPEKDAEKAFNMLRSLIEKQFDKAIIDYFKALEQAEPDDLELSENELEQLQCNEYISWDEFKRECGVLN